MFSCEDRIRTGEMSMIVPAGMGADVITPRPTKFVNWVDWLE